MSDDLEHSPSPFTIDPMPRNGLFRTQEVARAIAHPQDDVRDIAIRVRGHVNRGYLLPVGRDADDKRGSLLFDDSAVLAAAVMVAVADTGMASSAVSDRVGLALRSWKNVFNAPVTPCGYIWQTYLADPSNPPGWALRIQWRRHVGNGDTEIWCALWRDPDGFLGEGIEIELDGYYPTADMIIPIDPMLPRVAQNIARIRGEH